MRGLRRVALERGVRIFEHTPATRFTRERPLDIETPGGTLRAEKLVVATNAWAGALPELRRALVVVSSDIVATPPIPDRLAEIGWTGGEGITDSQMMVAYYRTTDDGRIAFGKGTAGVTYGGRIGDRFDRDQARSAMTAADFRRNYPALADVPIAHDWGGPIDRTPDEPADPRPPRRPRAPALRRRLERQRRRPELRRRQDPRGAGARRPTRLQAWSTARPTRSRPSPCASSARTWCARR